MSSAKAGSMWSEVPPSPRACNEKMIWKSKLYGKNQIQRGQNGAVGRLGSYIFGDPDSLRHLDSKMKNVTLNVHANTGIKTGGTIDVT